MQNYESGSPTHKNTYYDEVKQKYGDELPTTLTPEEKEHSLRVLNNPDPRPNADDGTLEGWLYRISFWGTVKIFHNNPDDGIKKSMTNSQFLNYVDDQEKNQAYGQWSIDVPRINKIIFYRIFWSVQGKDVTEQLIVDINLRPDLKKRLKDAKRQNSWLGKLGFFK